MKERCSGKFLKDFTGSCLISAKLKSMGIFEVGEWEWGGRK